MGAAEPQSPPPGPPSMAPINPPRNNSARSRVGAFWIAPGLAWLIVFLAAPLLALAPLGFAARGADGQIVWEFSLSNYQRLAGFGSAGWSADTLLILARSVWTAALTSVVCAALGYPLAFMIAGGSERGRRARLALVVIPIFTNLVIRTYAWTLLLGGQAPPAALARALGLIPESAALYPGAFATQLGMVSALLPFAALPLYASVERLDPAIVDAARDLYASRWRVFRHAVLPQTRPGLITALIMTFIPALGIFIVPDLLGGSKYMLIGGLIQQQFGESRDLPYGAAISLALTILSLAAVMALPRAGRRP